MDRDPVRRRRAQYDHFGSLLRQVGWACIALAVAAFAYGLVRGFGGPDAIVVAALIVSCITLLPGIILGYAVKKAEREDPE